MDSGDVEQVAFFRDALAVHDVEFGFAEGCGYFVFHDFDFGTRTRDYIALFDRGNAANVNAHRRVELQGAAASRGFRIAEHYADLFADLVNEDQTGPRLRNCSRQLTQSLRHQPRLQAHMAVAHLAVKFSFGYQRRNGVDDQHVDRT